MIEYEKIENYLNFLGFSKKHIGYRYLVELIKTASKKDVSPLKEKGYVEVSEKFRTNPNTVEKDIQYLISKTFEKGNVSILYKEFGESIDSSKGKPTNKQFIYNTLEKLKYY